MPSLVYVLTASNLAGEQAPQWGNNTREKWASEENEWGFHLFFALFPLFTGYFKLLEEAWESSKVRAPILLNLLSCKHQIIEAGARFP